MTRSLVVLVVLAAIAGGCTTGGARTSDPFAQGSNSAEPRSATPSSAASPTAPAALGTTSGACPTAQPAPLPAGQKRLVTIQTAKGPIVMTIEADLAPIAAGNFVALASCGFYEGVVFHRLVPGFVIQGGDPTGTGGGGPGYQFVDEPVVGDYVRGAVAMANAGPDTNGSQFFIILADLTGSLAKSYSLFGHVTSGMEVVDAIAAMPNTGQPNNAATDPVAMDHVTVSTP